MSKRKKRKSIPKNRKSIPKNRNIYNKPNLFVSKTNNRDALFWKPFEEYNKLDARQRADGLKALGMIVNDDEVLRVLTKSHFVIPGVTRFECQTCGECCRYARKIATFTYESCAFLNEQSLCNRHETRYLVCKWFPFWVYHDSKYGALLTIKPYCSGYGHGELVDYNKTMSRIMELSVKASKEDDGAFVIHELLHLPGAKEWVFPSKQNVDKLLLLLSKTESKPTQNNSTEKGELVGELNYAHHYTSGLLGSIKDPHLTVNEDGIITDVNEPFCQLCGQERSSLIRRKLSSLFVNNDGVSNDIKICLYRGKVTAVPHRLKLKNDSTLPVLFDAMTFRDRTDGLVHGVLICIKEISNIVHNELVQSRKYVRDLIEASLDAFMVVNMDGTLMDVNQAFVQIVGCSRGQLIGSCFSHHFINSDEAQEGVDIALRDGQVKNYELDLKTAINEIIPVSFNATVFHNHNGIVQGIFATARDVRDTRKIMKQLEDSKRYTRELIESSIDLMVTVNCDGIVKDVNESAVILTGYTREELTNSMFEEYFTDPKHARLGINTAFGEGRVKDYRLELINKKDKKIPVSFNASAYHNHEGNVEGVFAIARELSDNEVRS